MIMGENQGYGMYFEDSSINEFWVSNSTSDATRGKVIQAKNFVGSVEEEHFKLFYQIQFSFFPQTSKSL